jgi:hypothetical protein
VKKPRRNGSIQRSKYASEGKSAGAVNDYEFPALTEEQKNDAIAEAMRVYDEKYLQFRKKNKEKDGVDVVSLAVAAEGLLPSGRNVGALIDFEME